MSGLKTPLQDVLGLQMDGKRAILARYPNANPEIDLFPIGWISAKTKWAAPRTYPDPKWVLDQTPVRNVSTMFLVRLCAVSSVRARSPVLLLVTKCALACVVPPELHGRHWRPVLGKRGCRLPLSLAVRASRAHRLTATSVCVAPRAGFRPACQVRRDTCTTLCNSVCA